MERTNIPVGSSSSSTSEPARPKKKKKKRRKARGRKESERGAVKVTALEGTATEKLLPSALRDEAEQPTGDATILPTRYELGRIELPDAESSTITTPESVEREETEDIRMTSDEDGTESRLPVDSHQDGIDRQDDEHHHTVDTVEDGVPEAAGSEDGIDSSVIVGPEDEDAEQSEPARYVGSMGRDSMAADESMVQEGELADAADLEKDRMATDESMVQEGEVTDVAADEELYASVKIDNGIGQEGALESLGTPGGEKVGPDSENELTAAGGIESLDTDTAEKVSSDIVESMFKKVPDYGGVGGTDDEIGEADKVEDDIEEAESVGTDGGTGGPLDEDLVESEPVVEDVGETRPREDYENESDAGKETGDIVDGKEGDTSGALQREISSHETLAMEPDRDQTETAFSLSDAEGTDGASTELTEDQIAERRVVYRWQRRACTGGTNC